MKVRAKVAKSRPSEAKWKETYSESYYAPGLKIKFEQLPVLPHVRPGFLLETAFVVKAGRAERAGARFEFQDIRVYLRPVDARL